MIAFKDIHGVEQTLDLSGKYNRAYNADCMELLHALPDKCIDLACVDVPYGDGKGSSYFGNVEREREREPSKRYNRFGNPDSIFERYKRPVEPVRPAVRQVQAPNVRCGSTGEADGTSTCRVPPPQNMENQLSEPEEPGQRNTGKKS